MVEGEWSRCSASVEALAFEAEAAFDHLSFGPVGFHPVDPDVRACIGANVARPTHLKFTLTPAAFCEMAAGLPDFQPLPVFELPRDAPLLGHVALFAEALEERIDGLVDVGALAEAHFGCIDLAMILTSSTAAAAACSRSQRSRITVAWRHSQSTSST